MVGTCKHGVCYGYCKICDKQAAVQTPEQSKSLCGECENFILPCGMDEVGSCELGIACDEETLRPYAVYEDTQCPDPDWFDPINTI
jgi:hypothetical protein